MSALQDLIQILTADLRLSLLVVGAVVIAALIFWELMQRWRARKADEAHVSGPDDVVDVLVSQTESPAKPTVEHASEYTVAPAGEPTKPTEPTEPTDALPSMSARDDFDDRWASLLSSKTETASAGDDDLPDEGVIGPAREIETAASPAPSVPAAPAFAPAVSSAPPSPEDRGPETTQSPAVRIEWPPEDQRRVVGLRIVGKGGERFTGASLRQALQGEGFVHGEMDIFHRPVTDGRVLMSAASLTQPGTFNLDNMDASLFRGLNLFAVLPGPLPGREAVDKLLLVGHTLAQRVRGELQDGRGQPLTEAKLAEMRREAGSVSH